MRKRNQLYKMAKQTGDFSKYKLAHNSVVSNSRREKKAYFANLNPKNLKSSGKRLNIPMLSHDDTTVQTDIGKACYNLSHSALDPFEYHHDLQPPHECPEELLCNEEDVYQLLSSLDVIKANGPDGISARILKHTAASITPSITKLFNLSLCIGHVPS